MSDFEALQHTFGQLATDLNYFPLVLAFGTVVALLAVVRKRVRY